MAELGSLMRRITVITRFGGCVQNEFETRLIKSDVKESTRDFLFAVANRKPRPASAMLMKVMALNVMSIIPLYVHRSKFIALESSAKLTPPAFTITRFFLGVFQLSLQIRTQSERRAGQRLETTLMTNSAVDKGFRKEIGKLRRRKMGQGRGLAAWWSGAGGKPFSVYPDNLNFVE